MRLRTHTCKATACQHVISMRMLMCLDHWRMVPAPLRREVLQRVRQLRYLGLREDLVEQYRDAVARAVAAVEEKQERKAASRPGESLFT